MYYCTLNKNHVKMSCRDKLNGKVFGMDTNIVQRLWYAILGIIFLFFSDMYSGFPLGIVQLNQLEQLEKIDNLLKSPCLPQEYTQTLIIERNEVFSRYGFLSSLRATFSRELNSTNTRNATIETINSSVKNSKIVMPVLFCSNLAYTLSITSMFLIFILIGILQIPSSKDIIMDLILLVFLSFIVIIAYYIVPYLPKLESCLYTHALYVFINIVGFSFFWVKFSQKK